MKYVHIIDEKGFYKENALVEGLTSFTIETPLPSGVFYSPRWNGEAWEEGVSQEYIDSLKSEPELDETEKLKIRLDATENALLFLMEMGGM